MDVAPENPRTFSPIDGVLVREIGSETVLLDLRTERYLGLDPVASVIWRVLSSGSSSEEAVSEVLAEFDVDEFTARRDVADFIEKLLAAELITPR